MLPMKVEGAPKVAREPPICQIIFLGSAPPANMTWVEAVVISLPAVWKMKTPPFVYLSTAMRLQRIGEEIRLPAGPECQRVNQQSA